MENYWQILLTKWREKGKDGLTIPYLIGCQNYLPESKYCYNIKDLITEIAYGDCEVYISYCMNIKYIILGVYENEKQKIAGKFITQNSYKTNLFLTKFLWDLGDDLESVIESLIEQCQKDIDTQKYSSNNGEMGNYSAEEIDFIKSCFQ